MKRSTEKTALVVFACIAVYVGAYIRFVEPLLMHEHLRFFQAFFLLAYFFGVIPGLLLLRTARWVRVTIAAIAFSSALILSWMTLRWFIVSLHALGKEGSEFMIVAVGVHLSIWEFFMLLATFAAVASGYIILGSWILKR